MSELELNYVPWAVSFDRGRQEYNQGKPISANPYIGLSSTHERAWYAGWETEEFVDQRQPT